MAETLTKQKKTGFTKIEFKRLTTMSAFGCRNKMFNPPKRMFNSSVDKIIMKVINRMPQGNIGYGIAAINALIYSLYVAWPSYNMYSFMNNFTFSLYGLNKGYFWNLLTCHFSHMSLFTCLLDSGIIWLFCQNLSQMYGPLFVGRTIVLSLISGSMLIFAHQ